MDTKYAMDVAPRDAAAGAVPDLETRGPITLLCLALIMLALAAPLLVTLPQTLDAVASPAPVPVGAAAERALRHASAGPSGESWLETLHENELAIWRMRSSD